MIRARFAVALAALLATASAPVPRQGTAAGGAVPDAAEAAKNADAAVLPGLYFKESGAREGVADGLLDGTLEGDLDGGLTAPRLGFADGLAEGIAE